MDSNRWQRVKDIYQQALDLDKSERRPFVESSCSGDAALVAEVMKLLDVPTESSSGIDNIVESAAGSFSGALPDGERIGPYRILEVIGTGGMGHVYLAERADSEFEQRVAIKMVNLGSTSPSMLERFRLERQILADLDHNNIARLLDGGRAVSGMPYLVMELIDGESIVDYCDTEYLSLDHRLDLFLQVCDAVRYAHRQLVVHRDIKPTNILVTREGVPKLLDFGVAKLLDASADKALTRVEGRILTPEYASPEQILGEPVTTSTDVYGLGILLYELLSGSKPYDLGSATSHDIRELVCHTEPLEPSRAAANADNRRLAAGLAGDLDKVIMKAIRKEPERRYETVREFADDLRNFRRGRPITARAPSWSYRAAKFVQRNRTAVVATVAGVVAAATMAVFHTVQLADERDRANLAARQAEEVSGFLANLFGSASPYVAQGEEITAFDLLEEGSKQIDELDGEAVLKARLYRVIGESYTHLADYDKGLGYLEKAVALIEDVPEIEPLVLAETVASLAETLRLMQRHEESIAGYRRVLAIREAELGDDHPEVAFTMSRLGGSLGWQGRSEEALVLLRRALAIKTANGDQDDEMLDVLGITAVNLAQSGRFEEAIEINQRSLDLSKQLLGELHPGTVIRLGNSGIFHHQHYQSKQGLRLLDEAIQKTEQIYPADHSGLAYLRRWRSGMLVRLGRFDEGAIELEKIVGITRAGERDGSMEAVSNQYAVGRWHLESRDPAAYDAYQEGLRLAIERGRPDGPAVYAGRIGSAIALARSGELAQAEKLLVDVLQRRGRFQKSVEWYTRRELASVLSRQGKFDEASQQFVKIFSEQEHGPDSPGGAAIEILIERAAHHRRMQEYERAAADARLARELAAEGLPADNWIIAMADVELARAQIRQERTDRSLALLRDATDRLQATFGTNNPRVPRLHAIAEEVESGSADRPAAGSN